MTRKPTLAGAAALFPLFLSPCALAQPLGTSPWAYSLQGGAAERSGVALDGTDTEFSRSRQFLGAGLDYGWSRRDSVGVSVGAGRSDYTFDGDDGSGTFSPWGEIEESRVSITGRFGVGDNGSVIVIPSWRRYGEAGASSSDSQTYGLLTAAFWKVGETLTIGPGFGAFSRLEDSARLFPLLAIDWNITPRLNLTTGRGLAATRGPGLTLAYQFNPAWSLELAGRYEEIEFRLDDGGVGRDRSIPVVLSARYRAAETFEFSAFLGTELSGKLSLDDVSGNTIRENDYGTALLLGASFRYRY